MWRVLFNMAYFCLYSPVLVTLMLFGLVVWTLDDLHTTFTVYFGNNVASWSSQKQSTVLKCSSEAEYRALAGFSSEILWYLHLLKSLQIFWPTTPLYYDNINALCMVSNPIIHNQSKHIEIDAHFLWKKLSFSVFQIIIFQLLIKPWILSPNLSTNSILNSYMTSFKWFPLWACEGLLRHLLERLHVDNSVDWFSHGFQV